MKHTAHTHLAIALICTLAISGCDGKKNVDQYIKSLPGAIDIENITDCSVPASFYTTDFDWTDSTLTFSCHNEQIYDCVEINGMQCGDSLIVASDTIEIESMENIDGVISVNGGVDAGGICLEPSDGGTYRATGFNKLPIFNSAGTVTVKLSPNVRLVDSGLNTDVTVTDIKKYLVEQPDWSDFVPENTTIVVEHGIVTEIRRHRTL